MSELQRGLKTAGARQEKTVLLRQMPLGVVE